MKTKTIRLSDGWRGKGGSRDSYRVEQLGNSIEFRTGDVLTQNQVEVLCALADWKVTIVPRVK